MKPLQEYVSRKFILASASLATGFYLVISGHGAQLGAYTGLVATVLGSFNLADVIQDWNRNRKPSDKKDT